MRWIGTANRGYSPYAIEELRRLLDGGTFSQLAAGETFLFEAASDKQDVRELIAAKPPIFLRHVQPVEQELEIKGDESDLSGLAAIVYDNKERLAGKNVSVHVRKGPVSNFVYTPAETKDALRPSFEALDSELVLQQPELIFAVYAAADKLYAGIGTPDEMLSDWPGGAIRFQREEGQISRAKFKLLEAEKTFGLDLSAYRSALDIGAAPGGWTSLLLERGLQVTAIDPAELHESLKGHPKLAYLKRNASEVKFGSNAFDLLVCDMSWSPMQMVKLVLELQQSLMPQATAIITIKLMHRKPLQTIREVIAKLEACFKVERAKQLFHNREEITLFLIKK
ncbi:SAM-dependent methyltransferase [Paenibacillus thailandensis]|uniref:SAM-dependent methyltransferase n=1 Tax=Paenibacillus thailandensis TaxID=393250 RepID=A0ABW5QTT4_9BACL